MQKFILIILSLIFSILSFSQEKIKIWEGEKMPFYKTNSVEEYEALNWGSKCVFKVVYPEITIYAAKGENSQRAVVILPGGGYTAEAIYHEGYDVAEKLSEAGITAIVLKYRLPMLETSSQPEKLPISDVKRTLKVLRSLSDKYGIDNNKIGVLGFSAGSHLATMASVNPSQKEDENPNFSILIYGVTRLDENIEWLESDLFKRKMTKDELEEYNFLEKVDTNTPPAFLVHAMDDDICHYTESTLYTEALKRNSVDVEQHLFPNGGHGFGLGRQEDGTIQWIDLAINWIKRQ